jgi:hypothetical protein
MHVEILNNLTLFSVDELYVRVVQKGTTTPLHIYALLRDLH